MDFRPEWEWGWNSPLLLRPSSFAGPLPAPVLDFLATPIEAIDFVSGSVALSDRLAELRTSRIGFRFERIQAALFQNHPHTASVRTNIVVPGKTEIDVLHRLRTWPEGWIHWEVAVKFYLGLDTGGCAEAARFVGPSLKDSLEKKMRVIERRQLSALQDPALRTTLGIADGERVYAAPYAKGVLFLPVDPGPEIRRPEGVSEFGSRGVWITLSRFPEWIAAQRDLDPVARIQLLEDRKDWIRTPKPGSGELLKDYLNSEGLRNLQSRFAADPDFPPQQGSLRTQDSEIRFFVVDDGWPKRAEAMVDRMQRASSMEG